MNVVLQRRLTGLKLIQMQELKEVTGQHSEDTTLRLTKGPICAGFRSKPRPVLNLVKLFLRATIQNTLVSQ